MAITNQLGVDVGPVNISIDVAERMREKGIEVDSLSPQALEQIWDIIDGIAFDVGEFVDEVWPIDTGASHADWESTAEGLFLILRNPREYAEFVHRKGQTGQVYKEIGREAERLLSAAWPAIKRAAKKPEAALAIPADRPAFATQFLLPAALQGEAGRGALFLSRAAGFLRDNTRSRERARSRAR